MTVFCVTNEMDDVRSCTVKGQHETVCDGWQYRFDRERDIEVATGRPCPGCQPREAKKGLLCWECWERVEQAFADWTPELRWALLENDRLVQRDNGGIRSQIVGYVNLPATTLALNEVWSYLRSCTSTADLWVCTVDGAKDAVRFARAVPVAKRTHEIEERAHEIRRTRCVECGQKTLVWNPTRTPGGEVKVKCSNERCGAELPQASFEKIAAIEDPTRATAATVLVDGGQAVNRRGFFAEDYNPLNPEHEGLDPLMALSVSEIRALAATLEVPRFKQLRKAELIEAIRAAELEESA